MPKQNALEIDLDPELRSAFVAAAELAHRSTDDLLRELVQDYVDAQHEEPGYTDFVRAKVERARTSMERGQGRANTDVEAAFAALRSRLKTLT